MRVHALTKRGSGSEEAFKGRMGRPLRQSARPERGVYKCRAPSRGRCYLPAGCSYSKPNQSARGNVAMRKNMAQKLGTH